MRRDQTTDPLLPPFFFSPQQEEGYVTAETAKAKNLTLKKLSGTKFRQMLRAGEVCL
jgi:sulfate adenylyltransferase